MRHYGKQTLSQIALFLALALTLSGASFSQEKRQEKKQYVFRYEEDKRVLLMRFPFFYEGHLDDGGAFIPDPKARPIECKIGADGQNEWVDALEKKKGPIINRGSLAAMAILYYRYYSGGWLMPGVWGGEDFFPEMDKKNRVQMIRLEDYLKTYNAEFPDQIYNLPGRIVTKEEANKEKKRKQ